uniref:acyl-CoA (8-3)-desaturase n=1 Tax=Oryzias melastigma TaxID=30732 RepID=A0A3B3BX89_ORYME
MGVGGQLTDTVEAGSGRDAGVFTWEEVHKHCSRKDQWLVINRKVYNITQWTKRHPGGSSVISLYAGEDATEAFTAFHPDLNFVQKFLKPLLIGELAAAEPSQDPNKNVSLEIIFVNEGLRQRKMVCLRRSLCSSASIWVTSCCWSDVTVCAGWLQHDFGHLSVFKKSGWNHLVHKFVIGHLKGASASWWNHLHFRHHSKPNVLDKDPDVNMSGLFVLGAVQPVEYGIKKIKHMPYNHQHQYFFLLAPPLLIPVVFNLQILRTMISRRDWVVRCQPMRRRAL